MLVEEYKFESFYGERMIPSKISLAIPHSMSYFEGKKVNNITQGVKGIFRHSGDRNIRGGHGEGDYTENTYAVVTDEFEIKKISSGDILHLIK